MSKFDIGNFRTISKAEVEATPQWVIESSQTVQDAYAHVGKMYSRIKHRIQNEVGDIAINDRKIVLSRVAHAAGVDRSYITKRRTPLLCRHIDELNVQLELYFNKYAKKKPKDSKSKRALAAELARYKKLYKDEVDKNYSQALTDALNSELSESSRRLVAKNQELIRDNQELQDKVSNLTNKLRTLSIKRID
ncbi:hypothetical protein [Vibrio sp. McD22-P3]|uniref:hypothetical protein n=1 Tax=Vibrio sp. McD22-P3 TaxID=2724880 RepID=UPI001F476249|nr:hypothetical protein [Vibrio sp. McD22-P3]MCF4174886.1 hypothetical protein [Vibrio sp. McD22-P3]